MKVLVISGGSATGNTSRQCQAFVSILPGGWEKRIIRVGDSAIAHCEGCEACAEGPCIHDDDMKDIIRAFDSADVVVFATPIRFNGPSSAIKTVIDRFQVVWHTPDLVEHRRRFMTYIASSGSDNPDTKPCNTIFRSFCLSFGGVWLEPHVFTGTDKSIAGLTSAISDYSIRFLSEMMEKSNS